MKQNVKKIGVLLCIIVTSVLIFACGQKKEDKALSTNAIDSNAAIQASEQETTTAPEIDTISGEYVDKKENEGGHNTLKLKKVDTNIYDTTFDIYRLCKLEGKSYYEGDLLRFEGTDPNGAPFEAYIRFKDNMAIFIVSSDKWDLLKVGEFFELEKK